MKLILAICPTNQDLNPVYGGGNEMTHIAPLAWAILEAARQHQDVIAEVIMARPESADYPRGSLSNLIAQQRAAAAWISSMRRAGDLTVSLNLHSDSGNERHCGYYGPFSRLPISEWLGDALCNAIKGFFGNKVYHADYGDYIFVRETISVACPVLIECGTHTQATDIAAVRDHVDCIARNVVDTLVGFFGLETRPPLNTSELRTFPEWQLARLANGEDSRDVGAFRSHLLAIGADASDPSRYGVPLG